MIDKIFHFLKNKLNKQIKEVSVEKLKKYYTDKKYQVDQKMYRKYIPKKLNKLDKSEQKIIILFWDMYYQLILNNYQNKSKNKIILFVSLFYFIFPYDAIYDFIPFIGYLDDIFIINTAYYGLKNILEDYISWNNKKVDNF